MFTDTIYPYYSRSLKNCRLGAYFSQLLEPGSERPIRLSWVGSGALNTDWLGGKRRSICEVQNADQQRHCATDESFHLMGIRDSQYYGDKLSPKRACRMHHTPFHVKPPTYTPPWSLRRLDPSCPSPTGHRCKSHPGHKQQLSRNELHQLLIVNTVNCFIFPHHVLATAAAAAALLSPAADSSSSSSTNISSWHESSDSTSSSCISSASSDDFAFFS